MKPRGEGLRIVRVRSAAALREFIDFVYRLRRDDPNWVPPLRRDQRVLLDRMKHPFHEHAEVEYFLARRGGRTVGRIAAIENHAHNLAHGERIGFFGFLEAERDPDIFRALLRAAETWAHRRGLTALRGPCSFSTNEECGLLVEGFHCPPVLMTPYNPPHYREMVEACGYAKAEDLLCFWLHYYQIPERVIRLAEIAEQRLARGDHKVVVRTLDAKNLDAEIQLIKALYNKAWEKNWGFVPLTDKEMDFLAKELRPLVEASLILFVEIDGETVGFTLAMPDYNQALRYLDGKLGLRQILLFLLMRRRIRSVRVFMMGVLPDWRRRGIEHLMLRMIQQTGTTNGYWAGELSWILERNTLILREIEAYGAQVYRRYRIYEKALG